MWLITTGPASPEWNPSMRSEVYSPSHSHLRNFCFSCLTQTVITRPSSTTASNWRVSCLIFLWSGPPDEILLDLARSDQLNQPDVLRNKW